jgi:hypothetical protein
VPMNMLGLQSRGGERGPVTFPVFKAGDPALREPGGGFDSHTLPPHDGHGQNQVRSDEVRRYNANVKRAFMNCTLRLRR